MEANEIAAMQTKEQLLRRMKYYVAAEARRRKIPEWSLVSLIFGNGSGVSQVLWNDYINKKGDE